MEKIPVDKEATRFKKHLDLEENQRIILSGIFGIGKSYFIEEFFGKHQEEYILFKLNPVNYTVSNNEDIFELIKFDIAFQILAQDVDFEKFEIDSGIFDQYYLVTHYNEVIKTLLSNLKKIDHRVDAVVSSVMELEKKIQNKKEDLEIDEKAQLKLFIERFYSGNGIREENDITILINSLLQNLREQHKDKKIVLAIDDLDRIDPEHIFRILNVFSAHFDFLDGKNKFDFHKVILICDVENIRGIFHHRYGTDIDFTGYIDKFYSIEVFHYNLREVIVEYLPAFLSKIRTNNSELKTSFESKKESTYYSNEIVRILGDFVRLNVINMRSLINFLRSEIYIESYEIDVRKVGYSQPYNTGVPLLIIFDFLEKMLGGPLEIERALIKAQEVFPYVRFHGMQSWWDRTVGSAIMLLEVRKNFLEPSGKLEFKDAELDLKAIYEIYRYDGYGVYADISKIGDFKEDFNTESTQTSFSRKEIRKEVIPYYQLLLQAYRAKQKLRRVNY